MPDDYSISVDWSAIDRLSGAVPGASDLTAKNIALHLLGELKDRTPKAKTGQLHSSWMISQKENGTWVVGSPYKWAEYVNTGTRPHKAPFDAIREWAEFKGLPWFPIWLAIARRGTRANPYIDRSIEATQKMVSVIANQAIAEVLA